MTTLYPKNFARFYDTIYHFHRNGVDNQYFQKEIKKANGPVLEIGVGTGRLFMDALKGGADIYGLDLSPYMLDVLKGKMKEEEQFRISLQNIIDFNYDFQFELIIAPFRVFMHLLEVSEQLKALNNVFKHLKPRGRFIFDVFNPDLQMLITGITNQTDYDGEYEPGKSLKRTVNTYPDSINQIINVHFHLEWKENNKIHTEDWKTPLRYFFRFELQHLIERSNFTDYNIMGDYKGNELSNESKEIIVSCNKK